VRLNDCELTARAVFYSPYRAPVSQTTTRLQNVACRLTGAVDRANDFRKAALGKETVRMPSAANAESA